MVEKIQSDAEYNFYILGQHKQGKVTSTFGRKKLNINEISTATILARYKQDNKVMETVIPKVPLFLWDAFNCLNSSGSLNNEIFRKSGSTKRITDFFNQNPAMFARGSNFDGLNHLDIGTLMKDFLRERQDPLFTSGDQLLHEVELLTKRRVGIQFDTDQYPEFSTLLFILKVLHWMCLKDESGRMTPTNMAVYFNPIFIHNQVKEARDFKKGRGNYEKRETGKMAEMQKDRVQRDISILAALISQSQHLVVKSGLGSRYRSSSITPGVSSRDDDGRRSSSVIGRLMKYVGKDKVPKVTAIPISFLISKEFTPEGRQSRPRHRRTPNSAKSTSIRAISEHGKSYQSLPVASTPATSQDTPSRPHYKKSSEKSPRMRNEERVKDLIEARKRLDFTEPEEKPGSHPSSSDKPIPLNELLNSLQESVEKLNATPVPTSPSASSITFLKSPSPTNVNKCTSPEAVAQELISSFCEEESELSNVCEEIEAKNTVIDMLKKDVKDQGCSPFRFSPKSSAQETPPLKQTPSPIKNESPIKEATFAVPSKVRQSPTKVPASPLSCRTASGGWDWKAHVMHSTTREELDAHFKENFPTHRPSIALLTTYKRVTTNVARLEKNREEEQDYKDSARTSLKGRDSISRRISSGSRSFTKESEEGFKTPFLPKSKSAGSAPTGLTARPLGDKSSSQNTFAMPRLPSTKNKLPRSRPSENHKDHSHICRQFKDPSVPSYAASTFSSAQHSVLRPVPDAPSSVDFYRGASSVVSPKRKSHGPYTPFSTDQEHSDPTIPTLDDLTSLISKMSVSSFNSSYSEKENN